MNLKDMGSMMGENEGAEVEQEAEVSPDVKEKVDSLLDQAMDMLDKDGVDAAEYISEYMESPSEEESESPDAMDKKKQLVIMALKKKNGMSSDEEGY